MSAKLGRSRPYQSCLSKNFSITTENAAKPAQPTQAAFGPPKKTKKYVVSSNIAGEDNINTQLFVYGQTCVWQLPDGTILEQIMFACKHARFCVVVAVYGFSFAYFSQQS